MKTSGDSGGDRWPSVRHKQLWWWWLIAGGCVLVLYYLTPYESMAANVIYNGIGLVSCLMIPLAVRLHRPSRPRMWHWFAAGQITWVIGDFVWEYYKRRKASGPPPPVEADAP